MIVPLSYLTNKHEAVLPTPRTSQREIPSSPSRAPLLLLCLLLLSFSSASQGQHVRFYGLRKDLIHADSNKNLTPSQLLHLAVLRTKLRILSLTNNPAEPAVDLGGGDYTMEFSVNSPPVTLRGTLDTTTDNQLAQMKCECDRYSSCQNPLQASGNFGLGRGHRSIISQMGATKFSYCFTPLGSYNNSPLLFASEADLDMDQIPKSMLQSVKLHENFDNPSRYYLYMRAVTVGSTRLNIHTEESYGNGALFLDSRASISALDYKIYEPVLEAFKAQVELPVANRSMIGLDHCFSLPPNRPTLEEMKMPRLVLHFDGAEMEFPVENYMGIFDDYGVVCLMITKFSGESILGNFQQQNMRVLFDLQKEELYFAKSQCHEL